MGYQVDDDPPIKSHPASKEYRENWERMFGERPERRALPRPVECSTCGAKDASPCDDDIHETTGKPIER